MMATAIQAIPSEAREIQGLLESQVGELAKACPQHLSPERMIQVSIACCLRNPDLLKCNRSSLLAAVIQAGSLGLDLSPTMGEGYLIPRWNKKAGITEAQFMPGYRGLAKLARQAGGIRYIQAELVRAKDEFECWRDPDWNIRHKPMFGASGGHVTHVYAVAKLATGEYQVTVMTTDEINEIRQRSQFPNAGPWANDWGEMAKKTAIKRLTKGLPNDTDPAAAIRLAEAIEVDNREYTEQEQKRVVYDNNSGHGKGMYASPEQTEAYLKAMGNYIESRNQRWLDRWQQDDGSFPASLKRDLINRWQADNHLVKWAVETGRLDPAIPTERGVKSAQVGRFTGVIYHRSKEERKALAKELERYCDEQERLQTDKLQREHPELFEPEDLPQREPGDDDEWVDVEAEDNIQDLPYEPGANG